MILARLDLLIEAAQARIDAINQVNQTRADISSSNADLLDQAQSDLADDVTEANELNRAERNSERDQATQVRDDLLAERDELERVVEALRQARDSAFSEEQNSRTVSIGELEQGSIEIQRQKVDVIEQIRMEEEQRRRQEELRQKAASALQLPSLDTILNSAKVAFQHVQHEQSMFVEGVIHDPGAFFKGLGQGGLNILNGLQDAVIGTLNFSLQSSPMGMSLQMLGVDLPEIPSPNWAKDQLVEEDPTLHKIGKFIGGESLLTLLTLGAGNARHAGKLGWLRGKAGSLFGKSNCFVTGTPVVMRAGMEEFLAPVEAAADDGGYDWASLGIAAVTIPIAFAGYRASRQKRSRRSRREAERQAIHRQLFGNDEWFDLLYENPKCPSAEVNSQNLWQSLEQLDFDLGY